MTLDASQYLNPETVLMRKEEQQQRKESACGDCVHRIILHLRDDYNACDLRRRYGWRCISYQPKDSNVKNT